MQDPDEINYDATTRSLLFLRFDAGRGVMGKKVDISVWIQPCRQTDVGAVDGTALALCYREDARAGG